MISDNTDPKQNRPFSQRLKQLAAAATFVMALTILYFALSPQTMQASIGVNDKVLHLLAFGALILPCAIFFARSLTWILPLTLLFGGTIEVLQPGFNRDASWADFRADALGIIAGVVLGLILRFFLKKNSKFLVPKRT